MSEKRQRKRRGFWRSTRVYFRRFRIVVWILMLVLLGCFLYVNQVGLPGFIKDPLLAELRSRGVNLKFSRLRFRWYQGIVAEDVHFGTASDTNGPQLTSRQVQVGLNTSALAHRKLQIDELVLRNGRLAWTVPGGPTARELVVDHIQTHLRFLPDDQWQLDNFTADFANARIHLTGTVTNASALAQVEFLKAQASGPTSLALWQRRLQRLADLLDQIRFSAAPELRLGLQGDARSFSSFAVRLALAAPGADTPWGTVSGGRFTARLFAADTNGTSRAELKLEAVEVQSPWASVTNLHMETCLASSEAQTALIHGDTSISAAHASTTWATASNLLFTANWIHSITNPIPISGQGRLNCDSVTTRWGEAQDLELSSHLRLPNPDSLPPCDASWAVWTNIHPYALEWRCAVGQFSSPDLAAAELQCAGTWLAPSLTVTSLVAKVYEGRLVAGADLNVATRRLNTRVKTDFDPQKIAPVLPEAGRKWLTQFTWNSVPIAEGQLALTLPAWTNRQPDWAGELLPTFELLGSFKVDSGGTYRQLQISSASSHFSYSNRCWHLPDLLLVRPEGIVLAEHRANERTGDFYWHIISNVDPAATRPLLDPEAQKTLGLLQLSDPPLIDAEIWGRSRAPELTGVRGVLSLTNFSFRGQPASGLQTTVTYTNKVLCFIQPRLQHGDQQAGADGLTADFNSQLIHLTNGVSTFEPMVIASAIGPAIAKAIEPYVFSNPPLARVYGAIPMHGEEGADLHFQLEGGPFHWWRFNVPWIAGNVHWAGLNLTLRDVRVHFYEGAASGFADFEFAPRKKGADFTCSFTVTNCLLQHLMADVFSSTNLLEGRLGGSLHFTRAYTEDWNALFGYGDLKLQDGLIWDIPLFGIFTPILNGISPGLGHSRASAGTCSYYITNGIIRTDDLEIRSPALRLQYRGAVDLEGRVNSRVEAELLRDVWLVGPIVSTVLWPVTKMFEYRVTGTLAQPKTEPVYIVPKLMLMPFHPLRTIKGLFPDEAGSRTNAPALPGNP